MSKYELKLSKSFKRKFNKLEKSKRLSTEKFISVARILKINPYNPSLMTHKVRTKKYGVVWSSRIDSDLRIIWDFNEGQIHIHLLDIGGHSGSKRVY